MNQMNYTSTFSMQSILNQPLNPSLCKKILDQIKSPLMQQSFLLTNDQSINRSYSNIPKRPNIPPPFKSIQYSKRPAIKNTSNYQSNRYRHGRSFDIEQNGEYSCSSSRQSQNNFSQLHYRNKIISEIQLETIVSPLDPHINQKKYNKQEQQSFDLFRQIANKLCGALSNSQPKYQIQFTSTDPRKYHQRRKIFKSQKKTQTQKKKLSILLDLEQKNKSHIEVNQQTVEELTKEQIIKKLQKNDLHQIADFVQLCVFVMDQLKKASYEIQFCNRNISVIYSNTSSQDSIKGVTNVCENFQKALNRMNFNSVSNMLQKFSKNEFMKSNNLNIEQYHSLKSKIQESIQKIINSFAKIEKKIDQFVLQQKIQQKLLRIYKTVQEKFTSYSTKNSSEQITNLFNDIRLGQYIQFIPILQYIWPQFQIKLLSIDQLINGLMRNHAIYKKQFFSENGGVQFENQLSKMGYLKN